MNCAVIFGGMGFIGSHFAKCLLETKKYSRIYLYDIQTQSDIATAYRKRIILSDSRISIISGDVRNPITWIPKESVSLIANFAAVHREPGHKEHEYYETNIYGAENICLWAEKVECKSLIFTSSISPYGVSEEIRDENSLTSPSTAYGGSKLVAEGIHRVWQAKSLTHRKLIIIRPGVVFGPAEGGNVSRLIKAVLRKYFLYTGNRNTRKAGVYVKELCNALLWVRQKQDTQDENLTIFNMTMNPGPSISEYVSAICNVAGIHRMVPAVPYSLLIMAAYLISFLASPLRINHPFSPVRIQKLVRSNNILPQYLINNGYEYQYSLEDAFKDWKKECPEEWT